MSEPLNKRLAVCSWSLRPENPRDLASRLVSMGIPRVQLALDPLRENPTAWGDCQNVLREQRIELVSGMFGCVGEDYSSLESIRATGGIAPDSTWDKNWKNIQATAELADRMGLNLVTFHAGFLPHDLNDPAAKKLQQRLGAVADLFKSRGINLGLETGQETAADLSRLLQQLDRSNLGVNFDPANMLLYDKGDPIEALKTLARNLRQVHIKDARRTKTPGTWGEEVPVGSGEVDWKAFFNALKELNYDGNLVIEREAGDQREVDIKQARATLSSICT